MTMTMKFLTAVLVFICCLSTAMLEESRDVASSEHLVTEDLDKNFKSYLEKHLKSNDRARLDQKSLLIVFDTTNSMGADLEQLRSAALDVVRVFAAKKDEPIFNYVLSLFNDPTVDPPFITRSPEIFLQKINEISITPPNKDCPELSIQGLVNALESALPGSPAFLFSDASAKDFDLYDKAAELVQRRQSTVNFLLTGDCNEPTGPGFKVYSKISRISGGQVFNMNRGNVRDVLVAMSVSLEKDFVTLASIDSDEAGSSRSELQVDDSVKRLSVSLSGRNAKLSIKNSENNEMPGDESFSSANIKIITFDVTDGKYKIEASAQSGFSVRVGGISDLRFEFGFSRQEISSQSETYIRPISGQQNVLSIFASDLSLVGNLSKIAIIPATTLDIFEGFEADLKLDNGFYSTDLIEIPKKMFRIRVFGYDTTGNVIDRVISTGIESISTMIPEVDIDYDLLVAEIYGKITLNCLVKSLTTVEVTWTFADKVLVKTSSDQSSNLPLTVYNFQASNVGNYSCSAENDVGKTTQQVTLSLKPICKSECPFDVTAMIPSYRDCSMFYECIKGMQFARECPAGTVFDSVTSTCGDPKTSICASCNA